jgi:hypothetical protein
MMALVVVVVVMVVLGGGGGVLVEGLAAAAETMWIMTIIPLYILTWSFACDVMSRDHADMLATQVHNRLSTMRNTAKQQQPNRQTMTILRHLGAKLLQVRFICVCFDSPPSTLDCALIHF